MTEIELLVHGLNLNGGFGPVERELLQNILEDQAMRLSRIEKALGIEPLSDEEKKANAQKQWFAASEPWRDELRKARRE